MINRRKAALATMVVIVVTSVTTIMIGAYLYDPCDFGGCLISGYVKTVTLSSVSLYGGTTAFGSKEATASLTFSLNNPGSPTTITSITIGEGGGLATLVTMWSTTNQTAKAVNFTQAYSVNGSNALGGGEVSSFTFYPVSSSSQLMISQNDQYNYAIDFGNGQSISGTLIAVNG